MQKINIDHVNFTVKNFDETAKWYKDIFDFKIVEIGLNEDGEKWGILRNEDSMLAIYETKQLRIEQEGFKIYHFGFRLTDEKDWLLRLNTYKLQTYYNSPVIYPHSKSWYVKDPTGHTIEISLWENDKIRFST